MNELREYVKRKFNLSDADYKKLVENEKVRINNPTFVYNGINLGEAQEMKMKELTYSCEKAIVGQFKAVVDTVEYGFSNDIEAQSNFKDAMWALENNKATTVKWTAYDQIGEVVRLDLDLIKLSDVNISRLTHQQTQVGKFRDMLEPQVKAAVTISEVEAVTW